MPKDNDFEPVLQHFPYIQGGSIEGHGPIGNLESNWGVNYDGVQQTKEIFKSLTVPQRINKTGPFIGLVLRAKIEYYYDEPYAGTPPGSSNQVGTGARRHSTRQPYIKVWAQRPTADQYLIQPDWSYVDSRYRSSREQAFTTDASRNAIIDLYESFLIARSEWPGERIPRAGDTVIIDFEDKVNQSRGILVRFAKKGELQVRPLDFPEGASPDLNTAHESFTKANRPVSDIFQQDPGPPIQNPPAQEMEEAMGILKHMCPGPDIRNTDQYFNYAVNTPSRQKSGRFVIPPRADRKGFVIDYKSSGMPAVPEYISTVIMGEGKTVDSRDAPYLICLMRAALRDGIRLKLTSIYRTADKDVFRKDLYPAMIDTEKTKGQAATGLGIAGSDLLSMGCLDWTGAEYEQSIPGFLENLHRDRDVAYITNSSQMTLSNKQCKTDESTGQRTCDPPTGSPSQTPSYPAAHGAGWSNDISVRMDVLAYQKPQDVISPQYRWLCLNAFKYGFIRTVASERWHWECRVLQHPRPHMFTVVKRSSGSWDRQFNGRAGYYTDIETEEDDPPYSDWEGMIP